MLKKNQHVGSLVPEVITDGGTKEQEGRGKIHVRNISPPSLLVCALESLAKLAERLQDKKTEAIRAK